MGMKRKLKYMLIPLTALAVSLGSTAVFAEPDDDTIDENSQEWTEPSYEEESQGEEPPVPEYSEEEISYDQPDPYQEESSESQSPPYYEESIYTPEPEPSYDYYYEYQESSYIYYEPDYQEYSYSYDPYAESSYTEQTPAEVSDTGALDVRTTEIDENNLTEEDWKAIREGEKSTEEEIKKEVKMRASTKNDKGSFDNIKNDSGGDNDSWVYLLWGIVLIGLGVAIVAAVIVTTVITKRKGKNPPKKT